MRTIAVLIFLMFAVPSVAEEKKAARPGAHAKPTPQQIRKFNDLEKKEHPREIRGRSPNSRQKAVRAPSPK